MKTYVILNDIQYPFHDKKVLDGLVLPFIEEVKPDGVVLNGDIVDCYTLSSFDKNPMQKGDLNTEIRLAQGLMNRLSKAAKAGECWWLGGNHEDRLRRTIWKNAPALGVVEEMNFDKLFGLQHYGFQWKEYGDHLMLGKLLVTHGDLVREHSAWTARAHFLKYGTSVMIGHTQRIGQYHITNMTGDHAAYENGCLCRLDPEYIKFPNWQQGFAIVHVFENGFFNVQQIRILDRKIFFYGKEVRRVA